MGVLKNTQLRAAVIVCACVLANVLGRAFAEQLMLPIWFESFGTVLAAYVLGPICGAIVGAASNIIVSFWHPNSLVFVLTSVFIGVSVGFFAKKNYFDTFFHAMSVAGVVALGTVVISTTLNMLFFGGATGNVWGNAVRDFLLEGGFPLLLASAIGQLYLEFLDKFVMIVGLFLLVKLYKRMSARRGGPDVAVCSLVANIVPLGLVFALASAASLVPSGLGFADQDDSQGSRSYIQTIFNSENGLPCGHANAIAQTNDGILWIGTYAGLYRYNGSKFLAMTSIEEVKNANCLYVDEEGRLWVGTNDNGVVICIDEKVSNVLNSAAGLPSDSVRSLVQCADGNYYIGTSSGIAVANLGVGLSVVSTVPNLGFTNSLAADREGRIAAVTAEGALYILRGGNVLYEVPAIGGNTSYSCASFNADGRLWAGTDDGRIFTYGITDEKATTQGSIECKGLTNINQVKQADDGSAWVLADNGIGILSSSGKFKRQETAAFNYSIEDSVIDYQGNPWFASSRLGLLRLTASSFADVYADAGMAESVVNTTELWQGMLYAGDDDGLRAIDLGKLKTVENDFTKLMKGARVRCLKADSAGSLWACTYGKGLVQIDKSGKVHTFDSGDNNLGDRARVCLELSDGTMAIGGDAGLSFVRDGNVAKTIPYGGQMGTAKVLSLCELPDRKTLLAGTDGNGIVIVQDGEVTGHVTRDDGLTSGVILRMVPDRQTGGVFIVTSNSISYRDDNGLRQLSNFPYSNNYDIVLDDDGEMFVLGSSGIYVINKDELLSGCPVNYLILNSLMGLMGSLTANSWNVLDDQKNLYLSTDRGVFRVNLDAYKPDRIPYRLMVSEVRIDGESVKPDRDSDIVLSRDAKYVEFVPEIVNYSLEEPIVSFYLEGMDANWTSVRQSELSTIPYTNLPSGDYSFHLAISDEETGDLVAEKTYDLTKETPMYANWWFILYMILVGGAFVGWVSWFITRKQLERTLELQQAKLSLALHQVQVGNEAILAIANAVDAKDSRTRMHSHRVSEYAVMIAREYGFSEEEQENLRKAALLHDIGKIGIPDAVLNKPSKLTDEEYAIMKTHVTRGAEILKDLTFVDHADEGARFHHERYDGRGYPDGLKGEDIPLYGRIIAVADTFDAMTANRVYRKAQDFDYVMDELHRGRGTQFDPVFLDIFLGLIESGQIDFHKLSSGGGPDADLVENDKAAVNESGDSDDADAVTSPSRSKEGSGDER